MARPDSRLLDPARYPFRTDTTTRFADVDPNQHLNNVALAAMMEDGRVRFNQSLDFYTALEGNRGMVASTQIEYLAQGYFPRPVSVLCAIEAAGRTSWTIVQLLVQDGRVVAFGRSVIVCTDGRSSVPIPAAFRAKLGPHMLLTL